jgi:hypothetical protein
MGQLVCRYHEATAAARVSEQAARLKMQSLKSW